MKLRICDGGRERIVPASIEMVEQAFASSAPFRVGTEITLADGDRWLAALALEVEVSRPSEESTQFLLSGGSSDRAVLTGRLGRSEVLRRFRDFIREGAASVTTYRGVDQ
jgi:hypothetical protein